MKMKCIHLNPKIRADWQLHGQQMRVVTLGEKYYQACADYSGTCKVSYVGGNRKSSVLFISQLKHLKANYTITLIIDNYIIQKSRETECWLKTPRSSS